MHLLVVFLVVQFVLLVILMGIPAHGQERHEWVNGTSTSYLELGASDDPACAAKVTFLDNSVHSGQTNFTLSYNGVEVDFKVVWQGAIEGEIVYITAPEGFTSIPSKLQPGELQKGFAYICPIQPEIM